MGKIHLDFLINDLQLTKKNLKALFIELMKQKNRPR